MNSQNTRLICSATLLSSLLLAVGCEGNTSKSTQVVNPSDQESATTSNISTGEALDRISSPAQIENLAEIEPETTVANPEGLNVVDQATNELVVESEPGEQKSTTVPVVSIEQVKDHPREPIIRAIHDSISDQKYDHVNYVWYKNGEQFSTTSQPRLDKNAVRGDTIAVELRLTRDDVTTSIVSTEVVTINAPPRIWKAEFSPENATNRDELTILTDVYDSDGDDLEVSYSWEGFDIDGDTLSGSNIFPVYPIVVAYVTVSDGIDETSYKLTKHLFYSDLSDDTVFLDQPISFQAGFGNDITGGIETTSITGPAGMSYEYGWINWTPESFMLGATETFNIEFESEKGEKQTLGIVVESNAPKTLVEVSPTLSGKLSNISIEDTPSDSDAKVIVNFDLAGVRQSGYVNGNWELLMSEGFQQEQSNPLSDIFESNDCISTAKSGTGDSFFCLSEQAWPNCRYGRCDGWEVFYMLFEIANNGEYLNATSISGGFECTSGTLEQCRESEHSEFAPVALAYVGNDELIIASEKFIVLTSFEYAMRGQSIYTSELTGVDGIIDVHCEIDKAADQVEYCMFATLSGQLFVLQ